MTSEGNIHNSHGEPADASEETSPARSRSRNPTSSCNSIKSCSLCSFSHLVSKCRHFLDMSVQQRREHSTFKLSLCASTASELIMLLKNARPETDACCANESITPSFTQLLEKVMLH